MEYKSSKIFFYFVILYRYSGRTQHQAQLSTKQRREQKNDTSPESGAESSTLPRNYHHQNPSYHPPRSGRLPLDDSIPISPDMSGHVNDDIQQPTAVSAPPPPQSNSLTAISDIPIAEITGNKRHTMYNAPPAQLAVVTAPPSKELPSNLPKNTGPLAGLGGLGGLGGATINDGNSVDVDPSEDSAATYKLESVSKKTSKGNEAKGTMYALLSETTMASKKTSYSEKVAVITKESTFAKDGDEDHEDYEKQNAIKTDVEPMPEPSSTGIVSVDEEDDLVQGEVVSSQIITSRYIYG